MRKHWHGLILLCIAVLALAICITADPACALASYDAAGGSCAPSHVELSAAHFAHCAKSFPQIVAASALWLLAFVLLTSSFIARDVRLTARFHAAPLKQPPRFA